MGCRGVRNRRPRCGDASPPVGTLQARGASCGDRSLKAVGGARRTPATSRIAAARQQPKDDRPLVGAQVGDQASEVLGRGVVEEIGETALVLCVEESANQREEATVLGHAPCVPPHPLKRSPRSAATSSRRRQGRRARSPPQPWRDLDAFHRRLRDVLIPAPPHCRCRHPEVCQRCLRSGEFRSRHGVGCTAS